MLTHKNLMEITEKLSDPIKEREAFIAIPNKNGYMLHQIVGAELVQVDGDMDGEYGVLVSSPIASYHLDGGAEQGNHDPDAVPIIRYEFITLTDEEEDQENLKEEWPSLPIGDVDIEE